MHGLERFPDIRIIEVFEHFQLFNKVFGNPLSGVKYEEAVKIVLNCLQLAFKSTSANPIQSQLLLSSAPHLLKTKENDPGISDLFTLRILEIAAKCSDSRILQEVYKKLTPFLITDKYRDEAECLIFILVDSILKIEDKDVDPIWENLTELMDVVENDAVYLKSLFH